MVKLSDFLRGYALRIPSDTVNSLSLAAGVAETFTPPAASTGVIFSCTDNFYANATTTATVPGDVTNGSASELNPVGYYLLNDAGARITAISVISPVACVITASYYS